MSETYLHPALAEPDPHGQLLPGEHVRVGRPLKGLLHLLKLVGRERRPGGRGNRSQI